MQTQTILKPAPHCPIPKGHPLYRGYVPADETNIRNTWAKCLGDDYDNTTRLGWLEVGGFK